MKKFFLLMLLTGFSVFGFSQAAKPPAEVVPGVPVPATGSAWAVDTVDGKPTLVQIKHHDVRVNNHSGANLMSAPFSKEKRTLDVAEPRAPLQLTSGSAVFLARMYVRGDEGDDPHPETEYQIIRLQPEDKVRVVHKFDIGRFKGHPRRVDDLVETTITRIPDTWWLKIVPAQPLPPGEYAIEGTQADPVAYSLYVYDFGVSAGK